MFKRTVVLSSLFILLLSVCTFAEPDYADLKGDYSIFCLGDSYKITEDKINFLLHTKAILKEDKSPEMTPFYINLLMEIDGERLICTIYFHSGTVYKIGVTYQKPYTPEQIQTDFLRELAQKNNWLSRLYGAPTEIYYPPKIEEINNDSLVSRTFGKLISIYQWDKRDKKIYLGITRDLYLGILLIDKELEEENRLDAIDESKRDPRFKLLTYSDSYTSSYLFDTKTIKYKYITEMQEYVIDVWVREDFTSEGRRRFIARLKKSDVNVSGYRNLKYIMVHYLLGKERICTLSYSYYSDDNVLFSNTNSEIKWEDIAPGTISETIATTIEKYAMENLKK